MFEKNGDSGVRCVDHYQEMMRVVAATVVVAIFIVIVIVAVVAPYASPH